MEELINSIKKDFRSYISPNDQKYKKLSKLRGDLFNLSQTEELFEKDNKKNKEIKDKIVKLANTIVELESEIEEIKNNKIFENAFEWRFEFPEVLNSDGDFVGFDVVLGNPPYMVLIKSIHSESVLKFINSEYSIAEYNPNTYTLFTELAIKRILKKHGYFSLIIPNSWLDGKYFTKMRSLIDSLSVNHITNLKNEAFEEIVETVILDGQNILSSNFPILKRFYQNDFISYEEIYKTGINPFNNIVRNPIILKMENECLTIKDFALVYRGIETKDNSKWLSTEEKAGWDQILLGKDIHRYSITYSGSYINFIPKEMKSNANESLYRKDKILMRRTGNSIIATIDYEKKLALKNLYLIIPKVEDYLSSILGQLNSSLFAYYHIIKSSGENKAFAQFPGHYIEGMPCKNDKNISEKISTLVKYLIERFKIDPGFDSSYTEAEIDKLVFELYQINQQEIKLIKKLLGHKSRH